MIFKALLLLPLRWRCSSDCVISYVTHSCLENWNKFWLKLNMLLMMIQTKAQPVSMSLDWVFCNWVWVVTGAKSHESNEARLGKERQADKSHKTWGFYLLLDSPSWAGPALRIIGPFGCWDLPYFRIEASLLFLSVFFFSYNLHQSEQSTVMLLEEEFSWLSSCIWLHRFSMRALAGKRRCALAATASGFSLGQLFSGDRLDLS